MTAPTHITEPDQEKGMSKSQPPQMSDIEDAPPAFDNTQVLEDDEEAEWIDYKTLTWWYVRIG